MAVPAILAGFGRALGGAGLNKAAEGLFAASNAWGLADQILSTLKAQLPTFVHAINVRVVGGPGSDLRRVWYLALSAAFGRYRNRVKNAGGSATMQAVWDVTGKAAQVEIVYQSNAFTVAGEAALNGVAQTIDNLLSNFQVGGTSTSAQSSPIAAAIVAGGLFARGADPTRDPCSFIQRGPDQLTVGGGWPEFLMPIGTSVLKPPNGGTAITPPSSGAGVIGGLLFTTAVQMTPKAWLRMADCGADPNKRFPYAPLGTFNRFGASIFREWPVGQDERALFYPYQVAVPLNDAANPTAAADPGSSVAAGYAPPLPDDGRVITTGEKNNPRVQPPMPPVDGATRCHLLGIVAQSLAVPSFLPASPDCTDNRWGGTGVRVYDPGLGLDYLKTSAKINAQRSSETPPRPSLPNSMPNLKNFPIRSTVALSNRPR